MKNPISRKHSICILLLALTISVIKAHPAENINATVRPDTSTNFLKNEIELDGEVLKDETWRAINPIGGLTQSLPNARYAASEKTDIRVAYSNRTLYLLIVCYDVELEKLVVTDAYRDGSLGMVRMPSLKMRAIC